MRTNYFFNIQGSWTPGLSPLPRWTAYNARPTLSDPITSPAVGSLTEGSFSYATTVVPSSWLLSSATPTTPTFYIERLMESVAQELQTFTENYYSTFLGSHFYFNIADPEYVFVVESPEDSIYSVEIDNPTGGTIEITEAKSDLDLFWSGDWRYKRGDGYILVYGIGIQPFSSEKRAGQGDWQFVGSSSQWSSGSILFWEHPETKNWIPLHPDRIREDGFLNLNYSSTLRLRSVSTKAASALSTLTFYINDERRTGNRVNLWNSVDDKSLWVGVNRVDGESNTDVAESALLCSWFGYQTKDGLRDFISAALRQGSTQTLSATATGFNIPTEATGYTIKDLNQYDYVLESIPEDIDTSTLYRSLFTSPDLGLCWYGNTTADFSSVSGSVYQIDTHILNNRTYHPLFFWRLKYWTESGSTVSFSSNLPQTLPPLLIYFPSGVRIPAVSTSLKRKRFLETSPSLRWRTGIRDIEDSTGNSEFT